MKNLQQHISQLSSSLHRGESCGCMFIEGRPSEPSKCSGDIKV